MSESQMLILARLGPVRLALINNNNNAAKEKRIFKYNHSPVQ